MYQLLIDFTDINALNALYLSIYFGVIIKLLWAWNVEYSFIGSISEPAHTKITHPLIYQKKSSIHTNLILVRIVKYIRRKESSQDDTEEPISS